MKIAEAEVRCGQYKAQLEVVNGLLTNVASSTNWGSRLLELSRYYTTEVGKLKDAIGKAEWATDVEYTETPEPGLPTGGGTPTPAPTPEPTPTPAA